MKRFVKAISALTAVIMLIQSATITAYAVSQDEMVSTVISIAEAEVGYTGTSSYSKYGEWYGYQGGWCTTFALWSFNKAGENLGVKMYGKIVPSGGNCNSMISWFKNKGRYHTKESGYTPSKGDLIFFDWSGNGSSQHVGIVTGTSGSTVYTVEGNCSGKVKDRKYTSNGSKPYNNISAIMGYGSPDWSSVGKASPTTTTTKKTTTTTTTKKTTTKKSTTKKLTTKKSTTKKKNKTTTTSTTTKKTTTTTTTTTTTEPETIIQPVSDMKIYAATNELEIGDSVQLDYTILPSEAKAVVGYFCDEENIIEISQGGTITAIGEGTATVVVCANDEIYKQCDFTVTAQTVNVTRLTGDKTDFPENTTVEITEKDNEQKLLELGVNIQQLATHKDDYIIPLAIIVSTAFIAVVIKLVKGVSKKRK